MNRFHTEILPLKDALYRLALRITENREDAEDIVQETMLKVWNKRDGWDAVENLQAFTMTTCRNLSLDHLKRRENLHETLEDHPLHFIQAPSPLDTVVARDKMEQVKAIISALPEKQRAAVHLRDIEEKPYREIADILGISEEQVKVNIFRARQAIRKRFQQIED